MTGNGFLLQMRGISKAFPGVQALDSVEFDLYPGEIHALIGENGAGKSTLIKILCGALSADRGQIFLRGDEREFRSPREAIDAGIATINQELMLVPQLSVAENILLGRLPHKRLGWVDRERMHSQARQALSGLGLELDVEAKVGTLSVAQQQATEIARALSRKAEIIVMDEPTSALAGREIENLLDYIERLSAQGQAVILITHKIDEAFRAADRITVLRDGQRVGAKTVSEATPDDIIKMMVGRSVENVFVRGESEIGEPVLEVQHLSREGKFRDVSLTLHRGEVLGLSGLVGAGRTDLVRAIFGAEPVDSGEMWVDGKRVDSLSLSRRIKSGLGLVPEDRKRDGLVLGMSVGNNLTLAVLDVLGRWGIRRPGKEQAVAAELVSDLSIKTPSLSREAITLSGGNQQKTVLGKWLATHPDILILDEPTRGIDIGAKAEVHAIAQRLAQQGVAILLVSSELIEIMSVSDRILVMHEGEITGEFLHDEATEERIMACATGQAVRVLN